MAALVGFVHHQPLHQPLRRLLCPGGPAVGLDDRLRLEALEGVPGLQPVGAVAVGLIAPPMHLLHQIPPEPEQHNLQDMRHVSGQGIASVEEKQARALRQRAHSLGKQMDGT